MNAVLLTGRGGSKSVPGKNTHPILGRPLVYYPMMAAKSAKQVDMIYVTTDSTEIKEIAQSLDIDVIDRPAELAQDGSELTDVIEHALKMMEGDVEILITMHCNCAVHPPGLVDECINRLKSHPDADSCVSGYTDKSVHPFRTKRICSDGFLRTWMEVPEGTSNNRQKLDGCFVLDGACRAMRVEKCFPPRGQRPFTYLGERILPLENMEGGDVHSIADMALAEQLLKQQDWEHARKPLE